VWVTEEERERALASWRLALFHRSLIIALQSQGATSDVTGIVNTSQNLAVTSCFISMEDYSYPRCSKLVIAFMQYTYIHIRYTALYSWASLQAQLNYTYMNHFVIISSSINYICS
jgi:hypothetical protein